MNQSVSTLTGKTKLKIVFLGNQSVGKSSIIQQYIHNRFDESSHPTVGIDFLAKNIMHKNKNYRLQLWDTAGQQRFRSLIPSYLKDSQCALIIFDVTNKQTFSTIEDWIKMYNQNKTGGIIMIVGNKIDLQRDREVSTQDGLKMAQQLGVCYCQISARTGENIQMLFLNLITICMDPNFIPSKFNFKAQTQSNKIEEVEQKNQDDRQKGSKDPPTKSNFSKNKQKSLANQENKKQQETPTASNNFNNESKIKRTHSSMIEQSQEKDNKVIRLKENINRPRKQKGGCC